MVEDDGTNHRRIHQAAAVACVIEDVDVDDSQRFRNFATVQLEAK